MTALGYRLCDADEHYYEPDDCFTRHIERALRERTVRVERNGPGPGRMWVGAERCHFFSVGVGDNVGAPGAMKAFLRGESEQGGNPSLSPIDGLAVPEFVDRRARLATMDAQGVEACLMLPTAGVGVEPQLRQPRHREALYPSLRAFNRWLEEDWGYGADGRIFGAPLLSLADVGEAVAELDRLVARGARFVVVTCGPVDGRSPGDPHFDPFWARVQETGTIVVYHIGRTPFSEIYNVPWGLRPHPPSHRHSLMEYYLAFTERPITDTLTALVSDNLFGRFPGVRIWSVEYGSSWVAPLLRKLDHIARLFSKDMWRFGAPPAKPSDTLRRHLSVSPFFEDDVVGLCRTLGVTQVLAGSDYPHPEGLANPAEFADELDALSEAERRLVLRDNMRAQLG
jgi:predicted TIM-barrel fold metal-dependent hydrolase